MITVVLALAAITAVLAAGGRPDPRPRLMVFTGNIAGRGAVPELAKVLDRDQPDVAILTEAYHARRYLMSIPGYGLRQFTRKLGSEGTDVAVLVKHDVNVDRTWPLRMALEWVGPLAGKKHDPRVYPIIRISKNGHTWRLAGLHTPTHNDPKAQMETRSKLLRWVEKVKIYGDPIVMAGDFNAEAQQLRPFAQQLGGIVIEGTLVDHAIAIGADGSAHPLHADQPAGMHGWINYRLYATPRSTR